MKKLILSVLVVSSLMATSCKKAKETGNTVEEGAKKTVEKTKEVTKDAVEATKKVTTDVVKSIESAIEGVSIPEFKDPKVGEHLKAYSEYAKEYINAKGDVVKNVNLAKKGAELATKSKEVLANLDADATRKFNTVMNKIQSKMVEATK